MTPFIGRSRELSRLRTLLDARRNIVLTGAFGSGRTALVRRLADVSAGAYRFVLAGGNSTQREIDRQIRTAAACGRGRVVGVLDDVAAVTTPRLRFLREQVRSDHAAWLFIVERSVDATTLERLRAALGAAALVRLGPLSQAAAERLVREGLRVSGMRSPCEWRWRRHGGDAPILRADRRCVRGAGRGDGWSLLQLDCIGLTVACGIWRLRRSRGRAAVEPPNCPQRKPRLTGVPTGDE